MFFTIQNSLKIDDEIQLLVRTEIKDIIQERYPHITINPDSLSSGIWLNGQALWEKGFIKQITSKKLMKLKNIFLSALSINNFLVMFKKAYLRFFDIKNSISSQELNSWLDKNATSIEKFCSDLDYNLWQETKKETKKIN